MSIPGLIVGSSEPPLLRALGTQSAVPETHGVDFLWSAAGGVLAGVQRKETKDLLSSLYGPHARLQTELARARGRLGAVWLLIEGTLHFDRDGKLTGPYTYPWDRKSHWGFLNGLQASGVRVATTENVGQTVQWVEATVAWSRKEKHNGLAPVRPNPRGKWGRASSREWMIHLMTSFEGLSVGRAEAILDVFPMPLQWTVTEEEMLTVPGIGKKTARALTEALAVATVSAPQPADSSNGEGEA